MINHVSRVQMKMLFFHVLKEPNPLIGIYTHTHTHAKHLNLTVLSNHKFILSKIKHFKVLNCFFFFDRTICRKESPCFCFKIKNTEMTNYTPWWCTLKMNKLDHNLRIKWKNTSASDLIFFFTLSHNGN